MAEGKRVTVQPLSKVLGKNQPTRNHSDAPTDILTSSELVGRADSLFEKQQLAHAEVERCARAAIDSEYAYELAYATARISLEGGDGTVGYKDAKATQVAAEKKREMGYAREALKAAKKAEDEVGSEISVLQTLSAHAREEMKFAGRIDPATERTG